MDIDIVTELKLINIDDLFKSFPKNNIFKNGLKLENIKDNDDTITLIGEKTRNIII